MNNTLDPNWRWNWSGNIDKYEFAINKAIDKGEYNLLAKWYHEEEKYNPRWKILHKKAEGDNELLAKIVMGQLTK